MWFSSVQSLSCVRLFATPWTTAHQASLSSSTARVYPNPYPLSLWCHPTILFSIVPFSSCPQSFQHQGLFKWVRSSHQVTKVLEFQLQHQSFQWSSGLLVLPGLISFRMDWLNLLAVQGTLKSLLQRHSSKASILRHSAFLIVQPHPCMTTGKTTALTRWTFVDKVMSLLFNVLSILVIIFLPRSKHLLISWLQLQSAVILEPPKNKVSHCFPIYLPWSDGTGCHDISFINVEI